MVVVYNIDSQIEEYINVFSNDPVLVIDTDEDISELSDEEFEALVNKTSESIKSTRERFREGFKLMQEDLRDYTSEYKLMAINFLQNFSSRFIYAQNFFQITPKTLRDLEVPYDIFNPLVLAYLTIGSSYKTRHWSHEDPQKVKARIALYEMGTFKPENLTKIEFTPEICNLIKASFGGDDRIVEMFKVAQKL